MIEVALFGLAAGLDNLQVCSSLGLLPVERRRLHWLAMAFCASEIGGALIGLLLGRGLIELLGPAAESLAPVAMLLCGAAVLYLAFRREDQDMATLINSRALLFGLPLSLSLDNVFAGAGISFSSFPLLTSALIIGAISATMACIGLYLGRYLRRFLPQRIELAVGVYLCFLAVRMMFGDGD
jgi:manganese efflux pump family protein